MGTTTIWGRDRELAALTGWLDTALGGAARVVLCSGEPGIGKTRLAEELAARATARGVPVVWGRSPEDETAPPYWPWRQVMRSLGGDEGPFVLGAEPAGAGGEARFRLFDAATTALRSSAAGGLVVVLDDVHSADRPSVLLLRHVVRELALQRTDPVLLLATRRDTEPRGALDDVLSDLTTEAVTERLDLRGLDTVAVAGLLDSWAGPDAPEVDDELAAAVHEATGGNPFLVGELARRSPVDWTAGPPPGVRDSVGARVSRLTGPTRTLLSVAAVIGRRFSVDVVAAVVGRDPLDCLADLDGAVGAGLVEVDAGGHRFVHALVRDAIDAELPAAERVRLHRAAAGAVASAHATRPEAHLAEIARHWSLAAVGGDRARAADWIARAADEAMRRLAFEEASRWYARAAELTDDEDTRLSQLVALVQARASAADEAGALTACHEAADAARRRGRGDLLAEAVLAVGCPRDPDADRAVRALTDEALDGVDDLPVRARLLALRAEADTYLDDHAAAAVASRDALDLARRSDDDTALVAALRVRQSVCSGPDGLDERRALADRLIALVGDPRVGVEGRLAAIDNALEQGDLASADAALAPLASCAARVGGPVARAKLLRARATLAQARGRFAEALRLGDEAHAALGATPHPAATAMRVALRGAVAHHIGVDPAAADALATSGPAPGELAVGYRFFDVLGTAVLLTDAGRLPEAGRWYQALGPPSAWRVPPFFAVAARAVAVTVAVAQHADDDVAELRAFLLPWRDRHVVVPGAAANYGGPVALPLGRAAAALGELHDAVADLDLAHESCRRSGAAGYAVEIVEALVDVLERRAAPGDAERARTLAARGLAEARALDMRPTAARLAARAAAHRSTSALTPREREVAVHVARGMTNGEIAAALQLSERTAQNHVQHVLTKLGFTRRSQIAAWVARSAAETAHRY